MFLSECANETVSGQALPNQNRLEVVKLLKKSDGILQLLINALVKEFVQLDITEKGNDTIRLGIFLDNIEFTIYNIKSLLIHVLASKLPIELRKKVSRESFLIEDKIPSFDSKIN